MFRRIIISVTNVRPLRGFLLRHQAFSSTTSSEGSDGVNNMPDLDNPPLPPYKEREGETFEAKKARIVYQSRKRGMLENDLLLSTFCARHLDSLSRDQVHEFDTLINKPDNDWDIFNWIIGKKEVPGEFDTSVMKMLKEFAKNKDMEDRTRMPNLKATA